MTGTTRREFLKASAAASTGLATSLALGRAPAFAQKRELTFLSWNHFVPAADDELRRQAEVFAKQANCTVRVDTMAHLQMPAKVAAEAQSQSGHDMYRSAGADPFLYEHLHANLDDLVDKLGKQFGGWYPFAAEMNQTKSGWKGVPWFWVSFPGTYNQAHFKKAGFENPPKTWAELLSMGKVLKRQGNPVGIPISHCSDAHSTYWSVAWSFGAKVIEADGKTPAINSDKTAHLLDWYKELYAEAMEPEVLSWDDAGNNRFLLSGKGSWIHNRSPTTSIITTAPPGPRAHTPRRPSSAWPSGNSARTSSLPRSSSSSCSRRRTTTPGSWPRTPSTIRRCAISRTIRSGPAIRSSRCCRRRQSSGTRVGGRPSRVTPCSGSTTTT